ncbi:MAG: hypothetical protein ACOY3I_04225 [Verrucomicrobiota bacterium]
MRKKKELQASRRRLEQLRKAAVRSRRAGATISSIAKDAEVHHGSVSRWMMRWKQGGLKALDAGEITGRRCLFDFRSCWEDVLKVLSGQSPQSLWTMKSIQEKLNQSLNLALSLPTVWREMKKLGLIWSGIAGLDCRKHWLKTQYSWIKKMAREEKARIFFVRDFEIKDESQLPGYVISATSGRKLNFYYFLSHRVTADDWIGFMQALSEKMKGRRIFLITRRMGAYSSGSESTQKYLLRHQEKIKIFHVHSRERMTKKSYHSS